MKIRLPYDTGIYKTSYSASWRDQRKFTFFKRVEGSLIILGLYMVRTRYNEDGTVFKSNETLN